MCKYLLIAICVVLVSCEKDEPGSEPENGKKNEWVKISDDGMTACNTIAISGADIFVGSWLNGAYYSGDNGKNWESINTGLPGQVDIKILTISGNYLLAGTDKGIYRTSNKGLSWTSANSGLPEKIKINDFAKLNQNLYVATNDGVFSSSDNGTNWTSVNNTALILYSDSDNDLTINHHIDKLAVLDGNIFAFGILSGICRSSDNGTSWTKVNEDLIAVSACAVSGKVLYASTITEVYRSDDNGESWVLANKGKERSDTNAFAISGSFTYSAGFDVYRTSDNGANWTPFNTGLQNVNMSITGLAIAGNYLYASANNGVWRCKFE